MTEDDLAEDDLAENDRPGDDRAGDDRAGGELREHEVRTALLDLLAEFGTVTATEAAGRLGYSSGLCSFHLRQLARHGHIEEAPHHGGRARPWRLKQPDATAEATTHASTGTSAEASADSAFGDLARGLEDESWQRWLAQRDRAPADWRHDAAFSAVAYLTPEELSQVADAIRRTLAPYQDREQRPLARPEGARPVALITRLFPLLPHPTDRTERG